MQWAYGSQVPYRQFWGRRADSAFSLNEAQDGMLHQLLGICTGFGGYLRKLRFLLRRENVLPCFQTTEESAPEQCPVSSEFTKGPCEGRTDPTPLRSRFS